MIFVCFLKIALQLQILLPIFWSLVSGTDIIPRKLLFSETNYSHISLSPDGGCIAFMRPDKSNVLNVYLRSLLSNEVRQVTFEKNGNVLEFSWTGVKDIIIYTQDRDGEENYMLFKKHISKEALAQDQHKRTIIFARKGVRAYIASNNLIDSRIIVSANDENPMYHNIYVYDLISDSMSLLLKNNRFAGFIDDNDMNIRLAYQEQNSSTVYFRRSSQATNQTPLTSDESEWERYLVVSKEDGAVTRFWSFDKSNQQMYWIWGENNNLGTLVMFNFNDPQKKKILYNPARAEIEYILTHPTDKTVLAVIENYHKRELFILNEAVKNHLQYLANWRPQDSLELLEWSLDMSVWLVTYESSDKPYDIFLYRPLLNTIEPLFNLRSELKRYKLNKQVGFEFKTRDGMTLQAYISLPPDAALRTVLDVSDADKDYAKLGMLPVTPQKMVVTVHGGPTTRDIYAFNPQNAWLTNRGYAVLQVNYRGSGVFGKQMINAGNGEWGRKMHFDILDAVEFALAKGIANKTQIAIMGSSFGGYEVLVALTSSPHVFACGIDIFGPSNLVTFARTIPPYWTTSYLDFIRKIGGNPDTAEGRRSLEARSPLFSAERIIKPLMILHGANDVRVKQEESEQFVKALQRRSIPVTYILYPDEGHGFVKENNILSQYGFLEAFLHSCLGGTYEPFQQGQYNSSAIVKANGFALESSFAAKEFV